MLKTYKYRLMPTKNQIRTLNQQLEECRWLYNHLLEYRRDQWQNNQHSVGLYEGQNLLPALKVERPALASVHSQALQNVNVRLDLAFKAHFRRVRSGEEKVGYPRFKGYGRYDSLTYSQYGNGVCLDTANKVKPTVRLSKVGNVPIILHRPLKGKAKTAIINRSATGKFYICFSVECEPNILPKLPNSVGIDVGLKTFAALSDGVEIENPRFARKEEKALARAQRKFSKAEKGTPLRRKRGKVVARVHERIGWRRNNFSHQHSRKIINSYGLIAVEDIQVNRMLHKHCLARSISDVAWSMFFQYLTYKAEEAGRVMVKVNPAYTSQTCSACGHRLDITQRLSLGDRIFDCPDCHLHIDRDLNAARNIVRIGLGLQAISNQSVAAPAFTRGE